MKPQIDNDDIHTSMKIFNTHPVSVSVWLDLTLKSPDSFNVGTYPQSDKALCGKSLATTD